MNVVSHSLFTIAIGIAIALQSGDAAANNAPELRTHSELEIYASDAADQCTQNSMQIRVTVNGVTSVGIMKLELYSGEENFLSKKGKLRRIRVPAEDGPQLICINVPKVGSYAVAGYHDQDGNRRLKKKWDFTPREPFGISNNPILKRRKRPAYSECAFNVDSNGTNIVIDLIDLKRQKKLRAQRQVPRE